MPSHQCWWIIIPDVEDFLFYFFYTFCSVQSHNWVDWWYTGLMWLIVVSVSLYFVFSPVKHVWYFRCFLECSSWWPWWMPQAETRSSKKAVLYIPSVAGALTSKLQLVSQQTCENLLLHWVFFLFIYFFLEKKTFCCDLCFNQHLFFQLAHIVTHCYYTIFDFIK